MSLSSMSAFSPTGSGLYVGENAGGYTGVGTGYSGSLFSSSSTNANITSNVANATKRDCEALILKIKNHLANGEYNKAISEIETVKQKAQQKASEKYGVSLDDVQLQTVMYRLGISSTNYAYDEDSKGSFATGLFNGIPVVGLFFDSYSAAEKEAIMDGSEVSTADKIKEGLGKVVSGGAAGLALGSCIGNPVLGAAVGIALAFAQNIVKDLICAN